MSRKMKVKVAGVELKRGLKPYSWYAGFGVDNVAIEFRPHLGRRSNKPIDWNAYRAGKWGGKSIHLAYAVRLKACVEKVTALYWGEPCTHGSYDTFGRKDYPQGPDRGPWCPVCKEYVEL
jgi:hypothetical protein